LVLIGIAFIVICRVGYAGGTTIIIEIVGYAALNAFIPAFNKYLFISVGTEVGNVRQLK